MLWLITPGSLWFGSELLRKWTSSYALHKQDDPKRQTGADKCGSAKSVRRHQLRWTLELEEKYERLDPVYSPEILYERLKPV